MIWIAVGIGALLALIGCPLLLKTWLRRKPYVRVQAICLECDKYCGKTNKKFTPIFEYEYNGRGYTEESSCMSNELQPGETYVCYVNPENPKIIIPAAAKHEPLLMAIGCLLALAAGVVLVLFKEGIIVL